MSMWQETEYKFEVLEQLYDSSVLVMLSEVTAF